MGAFMSDLFRDLELDPPDVRLGELVFDFVQYLLDDDANLTPAGNLTGAARLLLRKRLDELIAAEEAGGATPGSAPATLFEADAPSAEAAP
jgi:hypothetical protein